MGLAMTVRRTIYLGLIFLIGTLIGYWLGLTFDLFEVSLNSIFTIFCINAFYEILLLVRYLRGKKKTKRT